jgi:hypothetical protein
MDRQWARYRVYSHQPWQYAEFFPEETDDDITRSIEGMLGTDQGTWELIDKPPKEWIDREVKKTAEEILRKQGYSLRLQAVYRYSRTNK